MRPCIHCIRRKTRRKKPNGKPPPSQISKLHPHKMKPTYKSTFLQKKKKPIFCLYKEFIPIGNIYHKASLNIVHTPNKRQKNDRQHSSNCPRRKLPHLCQVTDLTQVEPCHRPDTSGNQTQNTNVHLNN